MGNTFGSLFAGVGGFDLGMEAAGWQCGFQVEWDSACQQVLAHHWPDVPRWGDVSEVNGADLPPVDCITFGSPCQDLSVAGKRAGLEGARSGLFHQATRIIKEMRDATGNVFPRWGIWENVAGALSSNGGADFGAVLQEMANLGAYFVEWHVLDAQWFGVPQRRRRVFVVACFDSGTAARCPDPLLPVPSRSGWHPPSSGQAREGSASGTAASVGVNDRTVGTLCAADGVKWGNNQWVKAGTFAIESVFPMQGTVIGRSETAGPSSSGFGDDGDPCYTLTRNDPHGVVIGFSHTQGLDAQPSSDAWPTLRAEGGGHAVSVTTYVPDVSPTVQVSDGATIRFCTSSPAGPPRPVRHFDVTVGTPGTTQDAAALACIEASSVVRRLTPIECERLMGWPDDHTRWRADGKEQADTARYKQIGNGVASPVAAWIGKHLRAVDG